MSFLDELYYGNINPNENRNRKKLPYEKALKTFSDIEKDSVKRIFLFFIPYIRQNNLLLIKCRHQNKGGTSL